MDICLLHRIPSNYLRLWLSSEIPFPDKKEELHSEQPGPLLQVDYDLQSIIKEEGKRIEREVEPFPP